MTAFASLTCSVVTVSSMNDTTVILGIGVLLIGIPKSLREIQRIGVNQYTKVLYIESIIYFRIVEQLFYFLDSTYMVSSYN